MKKEEFKDNPLFCDPAEGVCGIPESESPGIINLETTPKPLKLIYFTDPICSSCWGIEPQLRKLKLEYGKYLDVEYRMGGLLPDWSYNSGGISKASDVAHHWDEVSLHYDMPIDGDVWLEDPLSSSYPPSIAFKAAQIQNKDKAVTFLRAMRELLFLEKKNITKWEYLEAAAEKTDLNIEQLKQDIAGRAVTRFEEDLKLAKEMGVRGFPTMFFTDNAANTEIVYGSKPYAFFEMAVLKLNSNLTKTEYKKDWKSLFSEFNSLTAKEFSELSGTPRQDSEDLLNDLTREQQLTKFTTKNGAIWRK